MKSLKRGKKSRFFFGVVTALSFMLSFLAFKSVSEKTNILKSDATATTAVYTVTSTSKVAASGTLPSDSSATYSQTYTTTASQITSGHSATLTLNGYANQRITLITLSMKSNSSKGKGTLEVKAGTTVISSVSSTAGFNTSSWYGSWSTSYVDVIKTPTSYDIETGEAVTIKIAATENSLYIEKYTISYEPVGPQVTLNSLSVTGNAKSEYIEGDTFDPTGLTVLANYDDGSNLEVTDLAKYTPDPLELGDDEITITYKGVSTTYGPITVSVNTNKSIELSKDILGLTDSNAVRTHTLDDVAFTTYARNQSGALMLDKSGGYIYNTTTLGTIKKIELNYASGGSASAVQYFNFDHAVISGHQSSGDVTISTSPKGESYSFVPSVSAGFFNLSVSSANHLQLTSLVIHYSLEQVDVEGITITKPTVTMYKNETATLGVTFIPNDATNKNVSWESSDATKVSVTGSGTEVTLNALNPTGATPVTITATSGDGNFTATSLVTVNLKHVTSVTLNKTVFTLMEGTTEQLVAEVLPVDASEKALTWVSSDTDYVTVSNSGLVTAIKPTATPVTVTATAVDNGLSASATITVNEYVPQGGTYTVSSPKPSPYLPDPALSDFTVVKSNDLQEEIVLGDKLNFRIGASPNVDDIMIGLKDGAGKVSFTMPSDLYVTSITLHDLKVSDGQMTVNVNGNQSTTLSAATAGITFNPYSNKVTINTTKRLWVGSISITTATVTDAAEHFANMFLNRTSAECSAFNVLKATWDELGDIFIGMDWEVIEQFIGVEGNPNPAVSKVAQMIARYEFIATKYGYDDFMNLGIIYSGSPNAPTNAITSSIFIVIAASLMLFVTYYLISKKRKYN